MSLLFSSKKLFQKTFIKSYNYKNLVMMVKSAIFCCLLAVTLYFFLPKTLSDTLLNYFEGASNGKNAEWKNAASIYDFEAKDIDGNVVSLSKYRGKVCIIVNVACKCGFTNDNYAQLQQLYEKYKNDGLSILGFPSNQFMGQEPWPEAEIKEFVKQYNVNFDMYSKIDVNGDNAHPLYQYLKAKVGGTLGNSIKWNFTKFLVDKNGQPVKRFAPNTPPKDFEEDIANLIKADAKL